AMYRAAERFGFQGGRILEPACGIGHSIGLMPQAMLQRSTITGIEIDPLSARIAKALYPDSDIRAQPFERSKLADGFYDLAISNVPFGDYTNDRGENFSINEYFAARPEMMLGRMRLSGRMYRDNEPTLEPDGRNLSEALSQAVERLPQKIYQADVQQLAEPTLEQTIPAP